MSFQQFCKSFARKKQIDFITSRPEICFSTLDLTAMGVGATFGLTALVLSGEVSKNIAGPGALLSFVIAAAASILAAACLTEFGARVPKAGSTYIYTFVTVGEFVAFLIGWNSIFQYSVGSALVARGVSNYIDASVGHRISELAIGIISIDVDVLAFGIVLFVAGMQRFFQNSSKEKFFKQFFQFYCQSVWNGRR